MTTKEEKANAVYQKYLNKAKRDIIIKALEKIGVSEDQLNNKLKIFNTFIADIIK